MKCLNLNLRQKASSVEKVDQDGLKSVAGISRQILQTETTIDDLSSNSRRQKQLLKLTDEELPAMLNEMGISRFTLDDGSEVVVKQTFGGSITQANKAEAFAWLRDHGHDDIIKNTISVRFGRGEDDQATEFLTVAENQGHVPEQKRRSTRKHSGRGSKNKQKMGMSFRWSFSELDRSTCQH